MIRISNIKVDPIKKDLSKKVHNIIGDYYFYNIVRESIDARHKDVHLIYTVDVKVKDEEKYIKGNIIKSPVKSFNPIKLGNKKLKERPIIIGAGPSSLFAAFYLSLYGFRPIIYERGKDVFERREDIQNFFNGGKLLKNSNVQFGMGGAGLFSDGKLHTGIKDDKIKIILNLFVLFGADPSILYSNHPHIGTDVLVKVVSRIKDAIISLGGEFHFESQLTDIEVSNSKIIGVYINEKFIKADTVILGIGNSARDTFRMLNERGVSMSPKGFAVGFRVIHERKMIDNEMYGSFAKYLDAATYKLTYNSNGHGVYSFCMCPGGWVINASSSNNMLTVNGMSEHNRDSNYSNSAIVVSVNQKDYGDGLFDGIKFQEEIERKAYDLGSGSIPIERYVDFKNNKEKSFDAPNAFKGSTRVCNLRSILPDYLNKEIIDGMDYFNTRISNFSDAVMAGVEARTSCPIRMERSIDLESNIKGLYPIGEGSGHSGGITSSALDGIKCALSIFNSYSSFSDNSLNKLYFVYHYMSIINYGYLYNGNDISSSNLLYKYYSLLSPFELMSVKTGICYDFVELERFLLDFYSINNKSYIIYDDSLNFTHTFIISFINDKYYYLESSFEKYKGVYEFDSLDDALSFVKNNFMKEYGISSVSINSYNTPSFGISMKEFFESVKKKEA